MSAAADPTPCSILLLAGGRGQRMGGADKGLVEFAGRPLIAWLAERVGPLTDDLLISCNRNAERYSPYADRLLADEEEGFPGPLAGIRAGLAAMRHELLLVLPCDAPLIDAPLLAAMRRRAADVPGRPLLLRQAGQWQPLFCLIPRSLQGDLERAWLGGERSPRRFLLEHGAQALDCAADDPRLANLNTPQALAEAGMALAESDPHPLSGALPC